MIGVKYFRAHYSSIEREMNDWLKENQDIKIEYVKSEIVQNYINIFIIYRKGGKV